MSLICPRCEKPLGDRHDEKACLRKRFSRRFFFGLLAGAAVSAKVAPKVELPMHKADFIKIVQHPRALSNADLIAIQMERVREQLLDLFIANDDRIARLFRDKLFGGEEDLTHSISYPLVS